VVGQGFQGKFRGKVIDNRDPLHLGRVRVEVPEVLGDGTMSWAMPCVPYAGPGVGLLAPPPSGANVWVEFEAGMADRPIWVGCFWAEGQLPAKPPSPDGVVFRAGAVTLVTAGGPGPDMVAPAAPGATAAELIVSADGLVVSQNGRAVLTINQDTVTVELVALKVALSTSDGTVKLASGSAGVTVAADSIEIAQGPSKARVSADGVALSSGTGSARVASAAVELANGNGKVAVGPVTVNINNGALEVS
jgi:type VI secretion system (T6SS) baseplate-like injector VgrG